MHYISILSLHDALPISWVFDGPSKIVNYESIRQEPIVGEIRHCDNLEQIKSLEPALRYGLQEQLRLNDQLLRDVLPVMCAEDRKSTRLNSSHVAISYAV